MSASDSDWSTGLQIVAAIVVGIAVIGGPLWYFEVGGGYFEYVAVGGALVGAVVGFVAASYLMYGR